MVGTTKRLLHQQQYYTETNTSKRKFSENFGWNERTSKKTYQIEREAEDIEKSRYYH